LHPTGETAAAQHTNIRGGPMQVLPAHHLTTLLGQSGEHSLQTQPDESLI
jgi:hypothetical protein